MRTPFIGLLTLSLLATSTAHAAARVAASPQGQLVADDDGEGDDVCDPDALSQFMPFSFNDDMVEPVDDMSVMTILINILPLGGLWGPLVLNKDDDAPKLDGDIAVAYLVPYLGGWALGVAVAFGAGALTFWAGGVGACCGVIACVPMFYNAPVAAVNAWDRAYKCGDDSGSAPPKSKKKSKKRSSDESAPAPKKDPGGDEAYGY